MAGQLAAVTVDNGADAPPAALEAGRLLSASAQELRESYRDRESDYPADWRSALGTNYDVLHVRTDELVTLQRRLVGLLGEYRRLSPAERPPGARRVQVTVDLTPWFPPPAEPENADEPG